MAIPLSNTFSQQRPLAFAIVPSKQEKFTRNGFRKFRVVCGNYAFGGRSQLWVDADQVEKFRKKFSGLDQFMEIPVLKGEIVLPTRKKSGKGGKKK